MKKKLFLFMMVSLVMSASLVGCKSEDKDTPNTKADVTNQSSAKVDAEETSEKAIEEIVIGEPYDINTGFVTDYGEADGWGSFFYVDNFYETLVNYENGKIVPGLAESWEVDNNELTFNLRKGVKFTDGSDFNAEVVKVNFEKAPIVMAEFAQNFTLYTLLKEIKVIDDYTVKLILTEPYSSALQELTLVRPMGIMSLNAFNEENTMCEEAYTKTFGSGKYLIENAVKGEDYTFIRNENYWGEKPKVKKFTVKAIPDLDSRIMALRTGEIDVIMGTDKLSYDAFSELDSDAKFEAKVSSNRIFSRFISLNTAKAPFNDKNVRLAVQYAVDKQSICNNLFYGLEDKADYLFNSKLPYCDISSKPYTYDVEKAKEILDNGGWVEVEGSTVREKDGQKLEAEILYESGAGVQEELALVVSEQLKAIGFDIKTNGKELMTCWMDAMGGNSLMFIARTNGIPYEPCNDINSMNKMSVHNSNQMGLPEKQEIDATIDKLSTAVDQDEIQKHIDFILTTLHDEATCLPISYRKELVVFNKEKIKDFNFAGQTSKIMVEGFETN